MFEFVVALFCRSDRSFVRRPTDGTLCEGLYNKMKIKRETIVN